MKILLLSPLPPPAGGIASWTKRFLQTPQAKENEVYIVNTAIIGKRASQLNKLRIIDEFKRTMNILKSVIIQLKNKKPDIVHLNTPCSKLGLIRDYLCGKIVKRFNVKLFIHCRCDVTHMVNSKLTNFFYKKLVELGDSIITLNKASQNLTRSKFGKDSTIIPNFIPHDTMLYLKEEREISLSIRNIIYVGHITKLKGCDLILKVAEYFPHIKFTLIGYLGEEIKQLSKPQNVTFTGEISKEEVIEQMKKADLFLFPTLTEGFPNALLEAMMCGLPVITTQVGAIPDMIEDKGGIIIELGNISGVIDAIKLLEHDKQKRKEMSMWNVNKVINCYAEEHVMNMIFKKYENIIK